MISHPNKISLSRIGLAIFAALSWMSVLAQPATYKWASGYPEYNGPYGKPTPIAISPGGLYLAVADSGLLCTYGYASKKLIRSMYAPDDFALNWISECLDFSADGKWLVYGGSAFSTDGSWKGYRRVRIFNPVTLVARATFNVGTNTLLYAQLSADGSELRCLGASAVEVWNVADGTLLRRFDFAGQGEIRSGFFLPDGKSFVIAGIGPGGNGIIQVRDATSGLVTKAIASDILPDSIVLTPDKASVILAGAIYTNPAQYFIRLVNLGDGAIRRTFDSGNTLLRAPAISNDGKHVSSFTVDTLAFSNSGLTVPQARARVYRFVDGVKTGDFPLPASMTSGTKFSPDGTKLVIGSWISDPFNFFAPLHKELGEYDWTTGKRTSRVKSDAGIGYTTAAAWSPDGTAILCGGNYGGPFNDTKNPLFFRDATTGVITKKLRSVLGHTEGVAYSADKTKFYAIGGPAFSQITGPGFVLEAHRTSDGELQGSIKTTNMDTRESWGRHMAVSPSGPIALAKNGPKVEIRSGSTLGLLRTFNFVLTRTDALAFSPDGKYLAICGLNWPAGGSPIPVVLVTNATTGATVFNLSPTTGGESQDLCYSPDGSLLAVLYNGSSVKIYNAATGVLLRVATKSLSDSLSQIRFTSDGRWIYGVTWLGASHPALVWWNAATAAQAGTLDAGPGASTIAFSPDGREMCLGLGGGVSGVIACPTFGK